jgi:ABC-2 type transport system permease protein
MITSAIEVTLWMAILTGMATETLGGFGREYYLAYALWANFVGRATANWMYEYQMVDEIDSGRVNAILVRPISFYEFYLSQFIGYKMLILAVSFFIPATICMLAGAPFLPERLPAMIALILFYLVFAHTISFCVACMAFHLNRAHSLTGMKNLAIWVLSGELIPLDLYPEPFRGWLLSSPFAAAVYTPVGYVTGRVGQEALLNSFASVAVSLVVMGFVASLLWKNGVRQYTGTGA